MRDALSLLRFIIFSIFIDIYTSLYISYNLLSFIWSVNKNKENFIEKLGLIEYMRLITEKMSF